MREALTRTPLGRANRRDIPSRPSTPGGRLGSERGAFPARQELLELYAKFCDEYPMVSIEDPFDQDDFDSYSRMTKQLGKKVQIVGDDLLCYAMLCYAMLC